MNSQIPESVRPILEKYASLVNEQLPGLVSAFYIVGSIALDGYDAFLTVLSDWGIQWTVLGVLRQYYTFQENSIATKLATGKYALNHLSQRWHRIIHDAIDIREGSKGHHYRSRMLRMLDALGLVKFIIQTSNESKGATS